MSTANNRYTLLDHLTKAVQAKADELREDAIKRAVETFEKDLRQSVGQAAINLSEFYSVSHLGSDLHITVRIGAAK